MRKKGRMQRERDSERERARRVRGSVGNGGLEKGESQRKCSVGDE